MKSKKTFRFVTAAVLIMFCQVDLMAVNMALQKNSQGRVANLAKPLDSKSDSPVASQMTFGESILMNLRDDDIFLQVEGEPPIFWGDLRKFMDDMLDTRVGVLLSAGQKFDEKLKLSLYQQATGETLRKYLGMSLIAQEARRNGIEVTSAEIDQKVAELEKRRKKPYRFEYYLLTNSVYQMAYVEKVLKPKIEVPHFAITNLIARRHAWNLSIPSTNAAIKAQIETVRKKIVDKEISFAEAASEYSDCPDCSTEDGNCGTWYENDDPEDRDPEMLKAVLSMSVGEISSVFDTPEAFHFVQIVSKYVPTKKARDEENEVASVDVKHISMDKLLPKEEFNEDTAKEFLLKRRIGRILYDKQRELMKTAQIRCVIPVLYGQKPTLKPGQNAINNERIQK